MITYYVMGYWMGPLRTVSTTVTRATFLEWTAKQGFKQDDKGVWRNGRDFLVIESTITEDESEI